MMSTEIQVINERNKMKICLEFGPRNAPAVIKECGPGWAEAKL